MVTFTWLWANKRSGIAEACTSVGLVKWRCMAVKGNSGVTCISFDTLKDLTEQIFSQITLTQLRTLGIVMFIQLKIKDANETYRKLRTDIDIKMSIRNSQKLRVTYSFLVTLSDVSDRLTRTLHWTKFCNKNIVFTNHCFMSKKR